MADVRERGQLILITGFALAFTLVAIVLLLNTVIYTENIASRGIDRSADQALEFHDVVEESLGDTMVATNLDAVSDPNASFTDSVSNLSQMFSRIHIDEGTIATLNESTLSTHPGMLLRQTNESRAFVSGGNTSGNTSWVLADDITDTRRVRFNVNQTSLEPKTISNLNSSNAFAVRLDGTTNWTAYLYQDSGEIVLATDTDSTTPTRHCSVTAAEATIVLTGNGIEGQTCTGYEWAEGINSDYTIQFINGDAARGSYNLTVNMSGVGPNVAMKNFNRSAGPGPRAIDGLYSATIGIHYETPSFIYDTTIRVAPGEADDD